MAVFINNSRPVVLVNNSPSLAQPSINGLLQQGTNITIIGSGTTSNPYIINSTGGGGFTVASLAEAQAGTDNTKGMTPLRVRQAAIPVINVDAMGAVGDGTTDDAAAINSAITAAGTTGVVHFTDGKTYSINSTLTLSSGTRFVCVNGTATIKRANGVTTTLTSSASLGATTVNVASTTGFNVGDWFIIVDTTLPFGGKGFAENSAVGQVTPQVITSKTATSLTFTGATGLAMPNGAKVVRLFNMLNCVGAASTATTGNSFEGIIFDGNRTNNNHTNSWVFNSTITNIPPNSTINRCFVINSSSESVFVTGRATITDCTFQNLNGSGIHVSQADIYLGSVTIENCKFINVCEATNSVTAHSEGAIVFSTNARDFRAANNYFENLTEGVLSPNNTSPRLIFANNRVRGAKYILNMSSVNDGFRAEKVLIADNFFENAGDIVTSHVGSHTLDLVEKNNAQDLISITGNTFINSRLSFDRTSNFTVKSNEFITSSDYTYVDFVPAASERYPATIATSRSTQFNIIGNTFDNRATAPDTRLTTAIITEFNSSFNNNQSTMQPLKTGISTSTEYAYYNRNVKIADNVIVNYKQGIIDYLPSGGTIFASRSLSWIGYDVINNTILGRHDGGNSDILILIGPGVIAHGNKIYSKNAGGTIYSSPVYLLGVNDGNGTTYNNGGTQRNRLQGAIFFNNQVFTVGTTQAIVVGMRDNGVTFGNNTWNIQCYNNLFNTAILDLTDGANGSLIDSNRKIVNQTIPIEIVRNNPNFY